MADHCNTLFLQALSTVKTLTQLSQTTSVPKPPLADRVSLYGLYKQATDGDINVPEPPVSEHSRHTKHMAWKANSGLSSDEAKLRYVECLIRMLDRYDTVKYPQVDKLAKAIQLHFDQFKSSSTQAAAGTMKSGGGSLGKYGNLTYTPPITISSSSIMRSYSPAASLYRIASNGPYSAKQRSNANESFSGTTLNSSSIVNIKDPNTLSQRDPVVDVSLRMLSQSTADFTREVAAIDAPQKHVNEDNTSDFVEKIKKLVLPVAHFFTRTWTTVTQPSLTRDVVVVVVLLALQRNATIQRLALSLHRWLHQTLQVLRGRAKKAPLGWN